MPQVAQYELAQLEQKRPVGDILREIDVEMPSAEEIEQARTAANLNRGEFGREVGRCRVGWRHGEPLSNHPYNRSTILMLEKDRLPVTKAFAVAFRRWQNKLPSGVTFLTGVRSIVAIPEGAIIVWGKLVQCQICGRMLIGHPQTRYCPESVSPACRAEARRRRNERRRAAAKERRHERWVAEMDQAQRELDEARSRSGQAQDLPTAR